MERLSDRPDDRVEQADDPDRPVEWDVPAPPDPWQEFEDGVIGRLVEYERRRSIDRLRTDEATKFAEYKRRLEEEGHTRPIVGSGPETEFQRVHCGETEYRLTADDTLPRAVWADGLNDELGLAQDAKYIAATDSSFYRPETLPPFMRSIAEEKNDHMLLKYKEAIDDRSNPVRGLEIVTNDREAAAYFADRMRALGVHGRVSLRPFEESHG